MYFTSEENLGRGYTLLISSLSTRVTDFCYVCVIDEPLFDYNKAVHCVSYFEANWLQTKMLESL